MFVTEKHAPLAAPLAFKTNCNPRVCINKLEKTGALLIMNMKYKHGPGSRVEHNALTKEYPPPFSEKNCVCTENMPLSPHPSRLMNELKLGYVSQIITENACYVSYMKYKHGPASVSRVEQ